MRDQKRITICHVDDDPAMTAMFVHQVSAHPDVELINHFNSSEEAHEWLQDNPVDILFADVEMPGMDGLSLAEQVSTQYKYLVFITSHTKYFTDAFQVHAFGYLQKPFKDDELARIFNHFRQLQSKFGPMNGVRSVIAPLAYSDKLIINSANILHFIKLNDIIYIKSNGNYSRFILANGEWKMSSKNLKSYTYLTETSTSFIRIHRSCIINKTFVKAIETEGNRRWVRMTNNDKIEVSTNNKGELVDILLG